MSEYLRSQSFADIVISRNFMCGMMMSHVTWPPNILSYYSVILFISKAKSAKLFQHVTWDSGICVTWRRDYLKKFISLYLVYFEGYVRQNYSNILHEQQGNVLREDVTSHMTTLNLFISLASCLFRRQNMSSYLTWIYELQGNVLRHYVHKPTWLL